MRFEQATVAVLGTGIMGGPIARNVAAAGIDTRAWNRRRDKAEPLREQGVTVTDTPPQAVEDADIVVTMLADGDAVESVMAAGGALAAMRDDAVWVQSSTVGVGALERLARLAEERGVTFVDAPVLGTRQPAEDGLLIVLASGPEPAREACGPVFDAIAAKTVWLGAAGAATRLKLVVNAWLLALIANLAETLTFAEGIGVDPASFLDVIEGTPVGAPYARLKGDQMLTGELPPSFPLRLALKDAGLVLEAAARHSLGLPLASAVAERFERAATLGHADDDMAAVYYAAADGATPIAAGNR